jgi:hypothetical protein
MPFQPGQSGNPNGARVGKPWRDAIQRALARAELEGNHKSVNALAERLLEKAAEGDMAAIKELGDRVDGKVPQALTSGEEGPFEVLCRWASEPS